MTDRREEENIREEIRRSQAAPRRGKRVLTVILTLVVVLGVVVAAAWKDLSSLDSVRRLFSYNKVQQDEQGKAELYSFSNDRSNVFALLGDHLIIASTTNVSVLGSDGSLVGMVLGRRAARENENIQPEGMTYVLPIAIIDALCENAAAGKGNVAYTSVKFEWGDITENNVAKRNAVVTLGSGEKATRIRYESGAFYKKTSDGNEAKIEKINGKDCPTDFINFVAEAVRKPAVELTIGGATENV